MKYKLITQFFILLVFSFYTFAQKGESFLSVKTNHELHQKFGLKYPVTLIIKLLTPVEEPIVWKWDPLSRKWNQIPEKTKNDFFNGIEVYRYDANTNQLFVSVYYFENNDSFSIKLTGKSGKPIPFEFAGFTNYYDNRTAAITASADDWEQVNRSVNSFLSACKIFRDNHLWLTIGVITGSVNDSGWKELQSEFDSGYIEIASHSYSHPHVPYKFPDLEISGSKNRILTSLHLSGYFASKSRQYLYCWIEPYGESDSLIIPILSQNNYLIDRSVHKYFDSFSIWNKDRQIFERMGFSVEMGDDKLSHSNIMLLNDRFDYVFSNKGIYHLNIHPEKISWKNDGFAIQHLKYIANRKDAWYVSFGLLYVYNLTIRNSTVQLIRF